MAVDGPGAIDPHPEGAGTTWSAAGSGFLVSRGMRAQRPGEESRGRPLRGLEREGAQRRRPSVRHAKSRPQVDVILKTRPEMTWLTWMSRTPSKGAGAAHSATNPRKAFSLQPKPKTTGLADPPRSRRCPTCSEMGWPRSSRDAVEGRGTSIVLVDLAPVLSKSAADIDGVTGLPWPQHVPKPRHKAGPPLF